jgi:tetratricopeptide (TPR) repeat protein
MGLNRFLSGIFTFVLISSCVPLAAQSGQESLADAARRIRAEKANKATGTTAASQPAASPTSSAPKPQVAANAGELWQDAFDSAEEAMQEAGYVAAEDFYRKSATIAEKANASPVTIAYSYSGIGSALLAQRKYNDAETALRTALLAWSKAPGGYEEDAARTKAVLGHTLVGLARYPEAEQLLTEAVNTYHQHPKASLCAQSIPLDGLAKLYRSSHEYSKGERVYTETFALMTGSHGTPCSNFVALLDHLAELYADDNQWDKVDKVQQGAIGLALKMEGPQSELYGDTVLALAESFNKRRRYEDSAATYAKAAAVFRNCDPPAPHKLAQSLEFQELNLHLAGKPEEAKKIHEAAAAAISDAHQTGEVGDAMMTVRSQSMEARRNGNVEEEGRLIAQEVQESKKLSAYYQIIALNDSAMFHQQQQKTAEAEAELKQALELSIASTGASSASTADAHFSLGRFYMSNQRLPEAEQSLEAALSLLGPQDAEKNKFILQLLGSAYLSDNKFDRAETTLARMLKNAEDTHNVEATTAALQLLALVYRKTNRLPEAEAALTRSLKITEPLPKPANRLWAFAALGMAEFYKETGRPLQAEQLWVQIISFLEKEMGANTPALRVPLELLIASLKTRGQVADAAKYQERCDQLPPAPPMPPGMRRM